MDSHLRDCRKSDGRDSRWRARLPPSRYEARFTVPGGSPGGSPSNSEGSRDSISVSETPFAAKPTLPCAGMTDTWRPAHDVAHRLHAFSEPRYERACVAGSS